ncbi:ras-related protein Rab-17-like isoform X1 [Echeneis naucrates]|uniref:ras-related protein Rab-17-like isoform X1 n=1 Tax=Echeneis naucrates TaxID=173247 RepID=UPI0011134C1E|nr:ras-related protein Rab-17-like isoform X1 [Echeneis naucrates]
MGENLPRVPGAQLHSSHSPIRTLRAKMVLLGSSGVGKSSLALRFVKDEFKSASPTVGCAYLTRVVHLSDVTLRFEIWDTAGQEKYHSITPLYYRGAHVALVVYDISKRETFARAQMWLNELQKQYIQGSTVMWLIGNKTDLNQERQVSVQVQTNKVTPETESHLYLAPLTHKLWFLTYRKDGLWPVIRVYYLQRHQPCQGIKPPSCCWLWPTECMRVLEHSREGCQSGVSQHKQNCTIERDSILLRPAVKLGPELCHSMSCLTFLFVSVSSMWY